MSYLKNIQNERAKKFDLALDQYHQYRYDKIFDTVEIKTHIPKIDLDIEKSKYRDFDYNKLKYGKHFLFQTVSFDDGVGYEMSKPIMGTFIEYNVVDQAIEYKLLCPQRTWEYNYRNRTEFQGGIRLYENDIKIESILEWGEYVFVFGIWDKYPDWKEMKVAMKESFYYRMSRKDKIERVLR